MDAFENLDVWKRSVALAVNIYRALISCRDHALKDQMTRAAISISSNIAEGFERNSSRQFSHYLAIAKGSCGELRSQLTICQQLEIINNTDANRLIQECRGISMMLQGLIKYCRRRTES
ncbi:MAG: four helix bundle protein [Gammaproteobacteria bacterium]